MLRPQHLKLSILALTLATLFASPSMLLAQQDSSAQQEAKPKKKLKAPEKWERDIQKFEAADKKSAPAENGILFVGSSSIRMWNTEKWFPGMDVINRGFGGCEISDVNHFVDRIVLKYKPRMIVFYAGDNDMNKGETAGSVVNDYQKFLNRVGEVLPETHVSFLPIKPSISRWKLWPEMLNANRLIRELSRTNPRWHFIETIGPTLGSNGEPNPDYFAKDGLHLNETGYEAWTKVVRQHIARLNTNMEVYFSKSVAADQSDAEVLVRMLVPDGISKVMMTVQPKGDAATEMKTTELLQTAGDQLELWRGKLPAGLSNGEYYLRLKANKGPGESDSAPVEFETSREFKVTAPAARK